MGVKDLVLSVLLLLLAHGGVLPVDGLLVSADVLFFIQGGGETVLVVGLLFFIQGGWVVVSVLAGGGLLFLTQGGGVVVVVSGTLFFAHGGGA